MEKACMKVPVTQEKATEYVLRPLFEPLKPCAFEDAHFLCQWPKLVGVGFSSHASERN